MIPLLFLLCFIRFPIYLGIQIPTKEIKPDVRMPVISIGCGGLEKGNAEMIVSNWLSLGGRGIDTALNYNNQEKVKAAIDDFNGSREELFLTTKIPDCNFRNLLSNLQKDLDLLGTDYVDLLLIHAPRGGDCALAWKEMEKVYAANKTRSIGVSNFQKQHLQQLLNNNSTMIVPHVNQIQLNVLQNDPETIDFCTQNEITVEAYSPLGRANHSGSIAGNPVIKDMAKHHNVTAYQIAIKWIIQHHWVLTFQSSSKEHQLIDADVFDFTLTDKEMKKLDGLSNISGTSGATSSNLVCRSNVCRVSVTAVVFILSITIGIIIWRGSRSQDYHHHALINEYTSDLQITTTCFDNALFDDEDDDIDPDTEDTPIISSIEQVEFQRS